MESEGREVTVNELIVALSQVPGHADVVFSPGESCGSGYPEWENCRLTNEWESERPSGRLMIELLEEGE